MIILYYIWFFAAAYLALHYAYFHLRLYFQGANKSSESFSEAVSVVICARNEAENLRDNLPLVLDQKYSEFEVVVVNDHSEDHTQRVLEELQSEYSNLNVLHLKGEKNNRGKKAALKRGIEFTSHDYLLLTDADCRPASLYWIMGMTRHFAKSDIVLGVGPYKAPKNLAGLLSSWETFLTAQQYLSFARAKMAYMGVGRNLAYTKSVFEASDKFESHKELASGDDDLFISSVRHGNRIEVEIDANTYTLSEAPKDLASWWKQKRRHLSTSYSYSLKTKLLLGGFGIAQLFFYLLLPFVILYFPWRMWVIILLLKLALQILGMLPLIGRMKNFGLLLLFPLAEPLLALFLGIIHLQNKVTGHYKKW